MEDWIARYEFAYTVLIGACLGSFVNVVVARLPNDESVVRPRSRCPQCKSMIAWYDNLPIVSWLLLRGKCRRCQAPISPRYILVETLMAGLAGALFVRLGPGWGLVAWMPLAAALLAITFLDIDHWWVPDVITYPAMVWALVTAWLPGQPGLLQAGLGLLPAVLLFSVGWAFERFTGTEGLGFGDVKLLALLGLALGLSDSLTTLMLAALQGVAVGAFVVWRGGHASAASKEPVPAALQDDADWEPRPHAVPFGPFLTLGAFEVLLLPDIFSGWHHRIAEYVQGWIA